MTSLVLDIEADGLLDTVTKIHCMVAMDLDTGEVHTWHRGQGTGNSFRMRVLRTADALIMHNGFGYDLPLLDLLHGFKYTGEVIDTLVLSREWWPDRPKGHSLTSWCEELGTIKPVVSDWNDLEMTSYVNRCTEDVKSTMALYKLLIGRLT